MADFELPVLEGEDRRRVVEGLKACFAAYPEAVADFVEEGTRRGFDEGRKQGLAPLVRQFERRLGRPLTGAERQELTRLFETVGGDQLGDVVLDLSPEQLAAWLGEFGGR